MACLMMPSALLLCLWPLLGSGVPDVGYFAPSRHGRRAAHSPAAAAAQVVPRNNLARTPPMGWMSWGIFRCQTDCSSHPSDCIDESLYRSTADALVSGGFAAAGYRTIHIDDCFVSRSRDAATGRLVANTTRFPSGTLRELAGYVHDLNLSLGAYTAEGFRTCGQYPGSRGHEELDAQTMADWQIDYLKVDGCGQDLYYVTGYPRMGAALEKTGRGIVYACSWPVYTHTATRNHNWQPEVDAGCNVWRDFDDVLCRWDGMPGGVSLIIDSLGEHGLSMQRWAKPGQWHDADMLMVGSVWKGFDDHDARLVGERCLTTEQERTQLAIYAISAVPLIISADVRNISKTSTALLLNERLIAVHQDPLGLMGVRLSRNISSQVWAKSLASEPGCARVAVALYNRGHPLPADIGFTFSSIPGFSTDNGTVKVVDVWTGTESSYGTEQSYTAEAVAVHDTAFVTLESCREEAAQ